ncbi:MAG TPA: hypothetical protein VFC06_07070 [Demequina sp.]|nr:hypothetical protein [Demequina sp.]
MDDETLGADMPLSVARRRLIGAQASRFVVVVDAPYGRPDRCEHLERLRWMSRQST